MLCSHSARRSHSNLIRNRADHPPCIQGVTDVTELTYWSGSNVAPTSLSIVCANRTNRATAGSRVPRMKNSTQMAAGSPRARANLEQTHPPYPPINPISSPPFFPSFEPTKLFHLFLSSLHILWRRASSSHCDVYVCLSRSAGVYPSLSSICGCEE